MLNSPLILQGLVKYWRTKMNEIANIGHNNPPTPFEDAVLALENLRTEAKNWLDGDLVTSQPEADAIGKLTAMSRDIAKRLDALRVEEKRPHDEAGKAVQEKFRPYAARCDLIVDACKKALTPYLVKLENEKREKERLAREEADRQRVAAETAVRAAPKSDIEAREAAEALLSAAKKAEAIAVKAENDKAKAATGGRSMSLRTSYRPELFNSTEAARHYWQTRKADFDALLLQFAREDIAKGAREIPGFIVHEDKAAV